MYFYIFNLNNNFSHSIFIVYLRILNHEAPNTLTFQSSQICTTTLKISPTKKRKTRTKNKPSTLIGTRSNPWYQYLKEHSIHPYCTPSRSHHCEEIYTLASLSQLLGVLFIVFLSRLLLF